jgi:hypothetical protein
VEERTVKIKMFEGFYEDPGSPRDYFLVPLVFPMKVEPANEEHGVGHRDVF